MIGRIGTLAVAGAMVMGMPGAALGGALDEHQAVFSRDDEDGYLITAVEDDDDLEVAGFTDDNTGATNSFTSGVDSNDHTGSGYTGVSRDRDYSRGDKTRDFTRDGGDRTRDRSAGHTNDRSRNDTR